MATLTTIEYDGRPADAERPDDVCGKRKKTNEEQQHEGGDDDNSLMAIAKPPSLKLSKRPFPTVSSSELRIFYAFRFRTHHNARQVTKRTSSTS